MELLSIVLPCYNPPLHWQENIVQFLDSIKHSCPNLELIVVNDGCILTRDDEYSILKQHVPRLHCIRNAENKGKGYAIRRGVAAASGDFIIYTDIDLPYTRDSFLKIYEVLQSGQCSIAIGIKDNRYYSKVPYFRRLISKSFSRMIRILIGIKITDTQCGLKGLLPAAAALLQNGRIDRYLFDLEFIYQAERKGIAMKAVPVTLRDGVVFSPVKWRILSAELLNFIKILQR